MMQSQKEDISNRLAALKKPTAAAAEKIEASVLAAILMYDITKAPFTDNCVYGTASPVELYGTLCNWLGVRVTSVYFTYNKAQLEGSFCYITKQFVGSCNHGIVIPNSADITVKEFMAFIDIQQLFHSRDTKVQELSWQILRSILESSNSPIHLD